MITAHRHKPAAADPASNAPVAAPSDKIIVAKCAPEHRAKPFKNKIQPHCHLNTIGIHLRRFVTVWPARGRAFGIKKSR
ncbi:hypothetical protein CW304_32990 [Bacillus sp. UFRGS-B20]|nr:hypothetical protein CW304_32990 [Bacillus sp. UFRGS-B20]